MMLSPDWQWKVKSEHKEFYMNWQVTGKSSLAFRTFWMLFHGRGAFTAVNFNKWINSEWKKKQKRGWRWKSQSEGNFNFYVLFFRVLSAVVPLTNKKIICEW